MALSVQSENGGAILSVRASGKLSTADYEHFVPEVERLIRQQGKLRLLFDMHDFHGWEAGALWEDMKFDVKHFKDIERLAMVGEEQWEKGMSWFCKPFTTAKVRYFSRPDIVEARKWLAEP